MVSSNIVSLPAPFDICASSEIAKSPCEESRAHESKDSTQGGVDCVGAPGIEPGTSCTPCKRASRTAPRPVRQGGIIAAIMESGNEPGGYFLSTSCWRSAPTETSRTGTPVRSAMQSRYVFAAEGKSAHLRTAETSSLQPGNSS